MKRTSEAAFETTIEPVLPGDRGSEHPGFTPRLGGVWHLFP
jgi:hypothetical protein